MRFELCTNIRKYFNICRKSELYIYFKPDVHWCTGEEYIFLFLCITRYLSYVEAHI